MQISDIHVEYVYGGVVTATADEAYEVLAPVLRNYADANSRKLPPLVLATIEAIRPTMTQTITKRSAWWTQQPAIFARTLEFVGVEFPVVHLHVRKVKDLGRWQYIVSVECEGEEQTVPWAVSKERQLALKYVQLAVDVAPVSDRFMFDFGELTQRLPQTDLTGRELALQIMGYAIDNQLRDAVDIHNGDVRVTAEINLATVCSPLGLVGGLQWDCDGAFICGEVRRDEQGGVLTPQLLLRVGPPAREESDIPALRQQTRWAIQEYAADIVRALTP